MNTKQYTYRRNEVLLLVDRWNICSVRLLADDLEHAAASTDKSPNL